MNVTLPNGQTIEGVPEGTTKAQLAEKLKANGMDVPKEWLAPKSYPGSYGLTGPAPAKGQYVSAADDPANGGLMAALKSYDKGIYDAGGAVTDFASKHGASPEVAGGLGGVTNFAMQALPLGLGQGAKVAAPAVETLGKELMGQSLKPLASKWASGKGDKAVQTMLDEGVNVTQGGVDVLKSRIDDLHDQVQNIITTSNATVDKKRVVNYLQGVISRFENRPNALEAQKEVERAWMQFVDHPKISGVDQIPIQTANDMKRGYQKSVGDKGYGEMKTPGTESEKMLAYGLRAEEAAAEPGIAPLLSRESDLINAKNIAERRVNAARNNNMIGIGAIAPTKEGLIAFIADKWGLTKSMAARFLYHNAEALPSGAATLGIEAAQYQNRAGKR